MNRRVLLVAAPNIGAAQAADHGDRWIPVGEGPPRWLPEEGVVPNEETAIAIARAIFVAWLGKEQVDQEEPLTASVTSEGHWGVAGTLPGHLLGGVAEVIIARKDGRVLCLIHGS